MVKSARGRCVGSWVTGDVMVGKVTVMGAVGEGQVDQEGGRIGAGQVGSGGYDGECHRVREGGEDRIGGGRGACDGEVGRGADGREVASRALSPG